MRNFLEDYWIKQKMTSNISDVQSSLPATTSPIKQNYPIQTEEPEWDEIDIGNALKLKDNGFNPDEIREVVLQAKQEREASTPKLEPKLDSRENITQRKTILGSFKEKMDNLIWGSLTWLIETWGLIGSASELNKSVKEFLASNIYKNLPDTIKTKIEPLISEEIKSGQTFSDVLSPLNKSTEIKETIQKKLWVDTESWFTTAWEFLTPDIAVSATTAPFKLLSSLPKASVKMKWVLQDAMEWWIKSVSWLKNIDDNTLKLIKENPELALKELEWKVDLWEVVKKVEDFVKWDNALLDEYKALKELTEQWVEKTSWDLWASFKELSDTAAINITKSEEELSWVWQLYQNFVWMESWISWWDLADNFVNNIIDKSIKSNKFLSTDELSALEKIKSEINNVVDQVVKLNPKGNLKYEQLKAIRKNIDWKIDWKSWTKEVNNFLKWVRWEFDDLIKVEFPVTKEVDSLYKDAITFKDEIRETFGKDWLESESFKSTLTTLWKETNTEKLNKYAKLLDKEPEKLKAISKKLYEANKISNITQIAEEWTPLISQAKKVLKDNANEIINKIEKLTITNPNIEKLKWALKNDAWKGTDEFVSMLSTIFKQSQWAWWTARNEAVSTLKELTNVIWPKKMKELEVWDAIARAMSAATADKASIASTYASLIVTAKTTWWVWVPFFLLLKAEPKRAIKWLLNVSKTTWNKEVEKIAKEWVSNLSKAKLDSLLKFFTDNAWKITTLWVWKEILTDD